MKYLCKVCNCTCQAESTQEIVIKRKLCDTHLHQDNMSKLQRKPQKSLGVKTTWRCIGCYSKTTSISKPHHCNCGSHGFIKAK